MPLTATSLAQATGDLISATEGSFCMTCSRISCDWSQAGRPFPQDDSCVTPFYHVSLYYCAAGSLPSHSAEQRPGPEGLSRAARPQVPHAQPSCPVLHLCSPCSTTAPRDWVWPRGTPVWGCGPLVWLLGQPCLGPWPDSHTKSSLVGAEAFGGNFRNMSPASQIKSL